MESADSPVNLKDPDQLDLEGLDDTSSSFYCNKIEK